MEHFPISMNGLSVVILFGILQGIIIFLFFLLQKRFKEHQYVLYFIAALLFVQLHAFLVRSGAMSQVHFLLNSNTPFIFLFGPLIYFYSRNLLGTPVELKNKIIHLLPFLFYFGYSFNFFLQGSAFKLYVLADMLRVSYQPANFQLEFPIDPWNIQGWVVVEILSLHLIVYSIATLRSIWAPGLGLKVSKSRAHWITFLNFLIALGGFVMFLSEGGVINGRIFLESPLPSFSSDLMGTFGMYAVTCYLLTDPEFLKQSIRKYRKSSLSKEFMKGKLSVIRKVIEQEKLFLQTDFSLDLLAQKTGISKHHISQIINSELDCNFFDLTNQYRIEEAKHLLKGTQYIKMEQLAYELGYRSKSSFYNAFKKATNLTPARYQAQSN